MPTGIPKNGINKGRFKKGHKPSAKTIKSLKIYWDNYKTRKVKRVCQNCGKDFIVYPYRRNIAKFCSPSCRSIYTGKLRRERAVPILRNGYMYIKMPSYHRNHESYAKIADLVLEQKIGRPLKKNEIAHHIDECKTNDSPDNLEAMDSKQHDISHLAKLRGKKKYEKRVPQMSLVRQKREHQQNKQVV